MIYWLRRPVTPLAFAVPQRLPLLALADTSKPRTNDTRSRRNVRMAMAAVRSTCNPRSSRNSCGTQWRNLQSIRSLTVRASATHSSRLPSLFPPSRQLGVAVFNLSGFGLSESYCGGGSGCNAPSGSPISSADGPANPPTTRSSSANV